MNKYTKINVVGRGAFGFVLNEFTIIYLLRFYMCSVVHLCEGKSDKEKVIIKQITVDQMTKEERQLAVTEVTVCCQTRPYTT